MPDFCLPDLGEGLTEAEIVSWRVQVGDEVATDQIVVDVETAKAAVELPVPFAGAVTAVHAEPGQTVPVGAPLLTVAPAGPGGAPGFREPGVVTAGAGPEPGKDAMGTGSQPGAVMAGPAAEPGAGPNGNVLVGYGTAGGPARHPAGPVPVISPLVRRMARQVGLDLAALAGSGRDGLILRRDVEQAIRQRAVVENGAAAAPAGSGERRIPLRGVRRAAAEKLSRSRREIPEATVWVDVDATEVLAARAALNAQRPDRPVSLLSLIARFVILGLRQYPELNGRVEDEEIVLPSAVHLGFAVQAGRGLLVPVVHDAQLLTTRDLAAALARLTDAARNGATQPADLTGGTITVNNYGVFGVDGSAAIINHPEVAILGIGRIIDRPWATGGQLTVRKVGQLSLAFDHRVCDGGTAGGFLRFVADCIESPITALGEL
jgi:2-oxoisovalerate dehydrogenase E2 component (dihydrolipoyl transacylase)